MADERERRVEVVAPEYTVAFTNRGARLVSWTLARYRDARGGPEEMVPAAGRGRSGRSTSRPGDPAVDARLREALYQPSSESLAVSGDGAPDAALHVVGRGDRGREDASSSGRRGSWRSRPR